MKLELNFDTKTLIVLDSVSLENLTSIIEKLNLKDWKIESKRSIEFIHTTPFDRDRLTPPFVPNTPYIYDVPTPQPKLNYV